MQSARLNPGMLRKRQAAISSHSIHTTHLIGVFSLAVVMYLVDMTCIVYKMMTWSQLSVVVTKPTGLRCTVVIGMLRQRQAARRYLRSKVWLRR